MSLPRIFLLATAAFIPAAAALHAAPDVGALRDQFELATTDKDDLSRIEILRRILDAEPGDAKSHQLLIELWLKIQDYDMAESTLNAWPAAPPRLVALTHADILHSRDRDLDGAIRVLQEYLAKSPKDAGVLEVLVQDLLGTSNREAQLKALDQLIALERDATNLIRRANVKLQLGDYSGAVTDAKAAQALEPDASIVKGAIPQFERVEETLQMLPPLDAAIAANPKDFAKLLDRTWWLRYGGMLDRALADANAAAALQPDSLMAKIAVVRAGSMLGKVKAADVLRESLIDADKPHALETSEAIAASDLALIANPKDAAQLTARAAALNDAGQYLLARRDVETALALDPKAADAGIAGIQAAVLMGDDTGAATLLRQVEAMKPKKAPLARALGKLSQVYFEKPNLALALDLANKSLALQETEQALRVKAAALQRLGKPKEAAAAFARADALEKKSKKP
jgi:tetratricopeptide (TPR) repeat protein